VNAYDLSLGLYQPQAMRLDAVVRSGSYDEAHDELDRWWLRRILDDAKGNVSEAARRLGMGRKKLTTRLEELGLYSAE